jgi:hypothetical protein
MCPVVIRSVAVTTGWGRGLAAYPFIPCQSTVSTHSVWHSDCGDIRGGMRIPTKQMRTEQHWCAAWLKRCHQRLEPWASATLHWQVERSSAACSVSSELHWPGRPSRVQYTDESARDSSRPWRNVAAWLWPVAAGSFILSADTSALGQPTPVALLRTMLWGRTAQVIALCRPCAYSITSSAKLRLAGG